VSGEISVICSLIVRKANETRLGISRFTERDLKGYYFSVSWSTIAFSD
jgi:hypothetical protein